MNKLKENTWEKEFKRIEKLYKGKRAIFNYLDDYTDVEELEEYEGQPCDIIGADILDGYNDGGFDYCYWIIEFDDGTVEGGIPGVALELSDELDEEFDVAREEYCVLVNGNNEDCFDFEEDAIKFARERFNEEGNDSKVKVLLVKYGPRNKYGDEAELGIETIWSTSFKESINESFKDIDELAKELSTHFENLGDFYDIYSSDNNKICIEINWGDWKHDHLFAKYEAERFIKSKGYDVVDIDTEVTEEDGSDTYSAIHVLTISK